MRQDYTFGMYLKDRKCISPSGKNPILPVDLYRMERNQDLRFQEKHFQEHKKRTCNQNTKCSSGILRRECRFPRAVHCCCSTSLMSPNVGVPLLFLVSNEGLGLATEMTGHYNGFSLAVGLPLPGLWAPLATHPSNISDDTTLVITSISSL